MNLIYQYYRDPNQEVLVKSRAGAYVKTGTGYHKMSRASISAYAERVGATYSFFDHDLPNNIPPFYGIFTPFMDQGTREWFHNFDYLCFIDSDILATKKSQNVFDHADTNAISAWWMMSTNRWKNKPGLEWFGKHGHINSGVVIFPRSMYDEMFEFAQTIEERDKQRTSLENQMGGFDQGIINSLIRNQGKHSALPVQFNYHLGLNPIEKRFDASLIHYHRNHKDKMKVDFDLHHILKGQE